MALKYMMDIIVNIEKYVPLLRETLGMETTGTEYY